MSDANGDLVGEVTRYTPFGGYRSSGPNPISDRGFTGQKENMADLGLYYYNARYYAPGMGRFLSADTLVPDPTSPQSLNRYTYGANSPLNYVDPTGHCQEGYMGDDYEDASCLEIAQAMANAYGLSFAALAEYDWETVGIPYDGPWTGTSKEEAAWAASFVEAYRELLDAYEMHDVANIISKELMPTQEMISEQIRFTNEELYNGRITDNIGKLIGNMFLGVSGDSFLYELGYDLGVSFGDYAEGGMKNIHRAYVYTFDAQLALISIEMAVYGDAQLLWANIIFEGKAHEIAEARRYPDPPHIEVLKTTR